jgi:hypothetical protein
VEEAARRLGIAVSPDPSPEQVMFIRSDHYSFVQQGAPAISLEGGFQTGDPAVDGRAILDAGAQFAKLSFLISYLLAQNEKAPSWNPGDFFGEKLRRTR